MRAPHGLNILDKCLTSPAKGEPLFGNLSLQARMKSSRWRSIPKWQSLRELKGNKVAYEVYYELLIEERKSSDGLIAQQLDTLKNRRELAKIGFSEGVGYVPLAGIGWDAYRTAHKKDPNPARAVAATMLAHDPDPASAQARVKATDDKDRIGRAAAVEAIAQRGDASLLPRVVDKFTDKNQKVRYSAAAAVIRLSKNEESKMANNDR